MARYCTKYPACDCATIHHCKHSEQQTSNPAVSIKPAPAMTPANAKQVAGDHYKKYGNLQPWDVVIEWKMGYLDGTALKYLARWKDKGGIDDLKKAIHFIEKQIEVAEAAPKPEQKSEQNVRSVQGANTIHPNDC